MLICLTVSSRKDLSIAPVLSGHFHFICNALANFNCCYTSKFENDFQSVKMSSGHLGPT